MIVAQRILTIVVAIYQSQSRLLTPAHPRMSTIVPSHGAVVGDGMIACVTCRIDPITTISFQNIPNLAILSALPTAWLTGSESNSMCQAGALFTARLFEGRQHHPAS